MSAKLVIDMAKCKSGRQSEIGCSYKHHPENKGIDSLLEMIRFSLICRKCTLAPCIEACPSGALEKMPDGSDDAGVLKRSHMLCTGCNSCAIACPFGTIYTDLIPYVTSVCDVCKDRLGQEEKPLCVRSCSDGSIDYRQVDLANEHDLVEVFEDIVVKVSGGVLWEPFLREKTQNE